ncbi:MAG: hypothetical protein V1894_01815 [Chloroflexota bacterium]
MERIGEVIEATTQAFTTQCYELYHLPPMGSLVRVGDPPIYGVVGEEATLSIEPGRRPIARGQAEESEAALYRNSPQLMKLLRSEFTSLAVGGRFEGKLLHRLSPIPPAIHSFVYSCSDEEIREFSKSLDFLGILLASRGATNREELVSSCLRQMAAVYPDPHVFLVKAGKELTRLLRGDFRELRLILGRLSNE